MWLDEMMVLPDDVRHESIVTTPHWAGTSATLDGSPLRYDFVIEALEHKGINPEFVAGNGSSVDSYLKISDSPGRFMYVWLPSGGWVNKMSKVHPDWESHWVIVN